MAGARTPRQGYGEELASERIGWMSPIVRRDDQVSVAQSVQEVIRAKHVRQNNAHWISFSRVHPGQTSLVFTIRSFHAQFFVGTRGHLSDCCQPGGDGEHMIWVAGSAAHASPIPFGGADGPVDLPYRVSSRRVSLCTEAPIGTSSSGRTTDSGSVSGSSILSVPAKCTHIRPVRLAVQDAALSRRRSPVRIWYGLPTSPEPA